MKTTENVKLEYKKLREDAGLTLEALAAAVGYSVAAVNGLENNDLGSKRLRQVVSEALAGPGDTDKATQDALSRAQERARTAEEKLARVSVLLAELAQLLQDDPGRRRKRARPETGAAEKSRAAGRRRLRDIEYVSLRVLGSIPAGWPQEADPGGFLARRVRVQRGRFPAAAVGLEVRGDSMNAAAPEPILDGQTVILLPRSHRDPVHNDVVAALCDGQTTLKRYWCPPGEDTVLRAESNDPAFARKIVPAHEAEIQGVMVGRL